jgi:DNA polymerase III alpha subunit
MLPLFKSHYSVGKSILTLTPPAESVDAEGPVSVFDIAQKYELKEVVLVEDSLVGFLEAHKQAESLGLTLRFGLRLSMCDDMSSPKGTSHKVIVFAKNGDGCLRLNRIYSASQTEGAGRIDPITLKKLYNPTDLKIAIPFYDSFLFHNTFSYSDPCLLDHSFFLPTFFIERNNLPFDLVLEDVVRKYAGDDFPLILSKSIYYERREDFEAYQTHKCICGRGFSNKAKTLDMPNLDHCGSPEFCVESYLENESSQIL